MKNFIVIIIAFTFTLSVNAQESSSFFGDGFLRDINFSKPFISELHSTINKIEVGYYKDYGPYNLSDKFAMYKRPMVEIHLGFDASLFSFDLGKMKDDSPKWSFGLSIPVSIHVLEDMWEPITAAVIDVDYRFGSPKLSAIRFFDSSNFIKNISFMWLPIFHECTHLGDELVLAVDAKDYPLKRVNVSYEYTEFQVTLNDPNGSMENNHAFRIGGRARISDRGFGWFGTESFAIDSTIVDLQESTNRFEWNFEYQMQRTKGFLAGKRAMNILSIDVSSRVRLGIPIYEKIEDEWIAREKKESNTMTFNAYFGWKFFGKGKKTHPLGLYIHAYRGINTWGQLRNQGHYGFVGFALTYQP